MPENRSQKVVLDLSTHTSDSVMIQEIIKKLDALAQSAAHELSIIGNHLTQENAQRLINELERKPSVTTSITLPAHLINTQYQIKLDNLISNHRFSKNEVLLTNSQNNAGTKIEGEKEGRNIPKGGLPAKIIITSNEDDFTFETLPKSAPEPNPLNAEPVSDVPILQRTPIAEKVLTELLDLPQYASMKQKWEDLTNRQEALSFRETITKDTPFNPHPLKTLIQDATLKELLTQKTRELSLDKDQYDALFDVYGQYGEHGLKKVLATIDSYCTSDSQGPVFQATFNKLLKYMPSYLPFIEDERFQKTLSKIFNLCDAHKSWWVALLCYYDQNRSYSDISALFQQFTHTILEIEKMGLSFNVISQFNTDKDLPNTLNNLLTLLKKCPKQDRQIQWKCIAEIKIPTNHPYSFIIPAMALNPNSINDFDIMIIKSEAEKQKPTLNSIIPVFYRYIATQKNHLPINDYQTILDSLLKEDIKPQAKAQFIYLLAKSTSTQGDEAFNTEEILKEWNSFQQRTLSLDFMERLKKNMPNLGRALALGGGNNRVRKDALTPLVTLESTPPIDLLNKLLKASEYKMLMYETVLVLQNAQNVMMGDIKSIITLYGQHKEEMLQAVRLIKTKTVEANTKGQYIADKTDENLIQGFLMACRNLSKEHGGVTITNLQPKKTLLPLVTVFHLEYLTEDVFTQQVINTYIKRLNNPQYAQYQEKIETLFPYGLSLLQLIEQRDTPKSLTFDTLNEIQSDILTLICRASPTTKKEIREWMHRKIGNYFVCNALLNLKDEVSLDTLFQQLNFNDIQMRQSIERIVSFFDNPEEIDQQEELTTHLVTLCKALSPSQQNRFFTLCEETMGTKGLLSREQNKSSNSYIRQFKTLIATLEKGKSFDEFEQFISNSKEHGLVNGNVPENSLEKTTYLLNTLYPKLSKQGSKSRETFDFASKQVIQTPIESLIAFHESAHIPLSTEMSDKLKGLNTFLDSLASDKAGTHQVKLAPVKEMKEIIEHVIASHAVDTLQLDQCREIQTQLLTIIRTIEQKQLAKTETNVFNKISAFFLGGKAHKQKAQQSDYTSLKETIQAIIEKEHQRFEHIALNLYQKKLHLVNQYESIATRIHDFIGKALVLSHHDVVKNHHDVCSLIDNLITLDDQNLVLSLMYHYSGGLPDRAVKNLIDLFAHDDYKQLTPRLQKDFINAIITQMNNSVKCSHDEVIPFLNFVAQNKEKPLLLQFLHQYYQQAPYPPLSKLMEWLQITEIEAEIKEKYNAFDKMPCALYEQGVATHHGREKENGFKIDWAKHQLARMSQDVQSIFTDKDLNEIILRQSVAKDLSTEEILERLKCFKENPPQNHIEMVMYAAELLHRSKGRPVEFQGTTQISGRSYELNTTQFIAILCLLEKGNKITAEIGTGEGKSRIMMLLNACQFLKGNTVDFITSDLALAERDYLESLPFFKSLGAEVSFITSDSPIEDYKKGGINVSDPENLCLFRNKASIQNQLSAVLDEPQKRALLGDEIDRLFYDLEDLAYNSTETTPLNIDLLPLYPLLMEFFAQEGIEKTYIEDKKRTTELLLNYIEPRNPTLYKLINKIPNSQLEHWQDAAYTARYSQFNKDFTIVPDTTTPTAFGEKKTAKAMCYIGKTISKNAHFANGVHQCLHAELNRLMNREDAEISDPKLKEALQQCKEKGRTFIIKPEQKITSTSSSNSLVQSYNEGSICAVTGTIGHETEQQEATSEYGVGFIRVPRHQGMHRTDKPTYLTQNNEQQIDALVKHILKSQKKGQPILLICKDDKESSELHRQLQNKLSDTIKTEQLTRIHAAINYEQEGFAADYIKNKAGLPGQITIATEMMGRGVDIHLKAKAREHGLKVLLTYLPRGERDYAQIIGRSGRFGMIGETQMVLNVETLKKDFGIDKLNADYYLNPEDFIQRLQIFATHTQQLRRLFTRSLNKYLKEISNTLDKESLATQQWTTFLEHYKQSADATFQIINSELVKPKPNINKIEQQLAKHKDQIQLNWQQLMSQLLKEKRKNITSIELKKPNSLHHWMSEVKTMQQDYFDMREMQHVKVHEQYNPTAGGHMGLVKNPQFFRSFYDDIRAASKNQGLLFPNFRAWWNGRISTANWLSQLPIFKWFITPKEETRMAVKQVPASHVPLLSSYKKIKGKLPDNQTATSRSNMDTMNPAPVNPEPASKGASAEPPNVTNPVCSVDSNKHPP